MTIEMKGTDAEVNHLAAELHSLGQRVGEDYEPLYGNGGWDLVGLRLVSRRALLATYEYVRISPSTPQFLVPKAISENIAY